MPTPRVLPLHAHLWMLFGSLVLAVGALTCAINFVMTKQTLERATADAMHRISLHTLDEVEDLMHPAQMAVKLVSHSSLADATTLEQRVHRLALIRDALETSPVLQSLYLGYADGSFFYLRLLRTDAERRLFRAPKQAAYVVRSIEAVAPRSAGSKGRLIYFDASMAKVGESEDAGFADKFDPRQRPWYLGAIGAGGLIRTEPYMLFADQDAGATLAVPTPSGHAVVGGDFRLDSLGQMLAREESTPGSMLALLDAGGRVIAIDRKPPESESAPDAIKLEVLPSAADFQIPILTHVAAGIANLRSQASVGSVESVDGRNWYTQIDLLTPSGGNPLFLVAAIPQSELLKDARRRALVGLAATAIIILLSIPLIWLAARRISDPLHALAEGLEAIHKFEFHKPVVVQSRIKEVNALAAATEVMRQTIQRFLIIATAVSAETRLEKLLPLLLRKTLNAADGRAGVLYLADDQNLKAVAAFDRTGGDVTEDLPSTSMEQAVPLVRSAALTLLPQVGTMQVDTVSSTGLEKFVSGGVCHAAAIPLVTRLQELQGVILIVRDSPMEAAQLAFVTTLSGLCAGAIEVRALTEAQRALFDAFIKLLAGAIDAKSPHTGGHCERVPHLVKMLAAAACEVTEGPYESFQMTDSQKEALHVAAWLHDCGKVTTPEYIIDKATKLETLYDRIHEIRMRFEILKRDTEIEFLHAVSAGEDERAARALRDAKCQALDDEFAFVASCNQGGEFMDTAHRDRLLGIASRKWLRTIDDRLGVSHEEFSRKARVPAPALPVWEPLLADKDEHIIERTAHDRIPADNPWGFKLNTPQHLYDRGELHNLLVSRGTLSTEERFKIEDHIVQTQIMLSLLPFPKALRNVPEIAGGHHEKMDGTGYPRRLHREQMSPLARMMAIADVFEALTAADRPYKRAKTLSESIRIMATARDQHHIDSELFDLFLTSGVYLRYAERYMRSEQIDHVDIAQYVRPV
ncbi:HD domain-containing protein [Cupriavidus sp. SW-Y-13]|nr:HD domain-containing protein [Cupriavidus sp. SW-Y-13]